MIAVYVQRGRVTQALEIFSKMHEKGLNPNNVTLFNVLSACSSLEALVMGQLVHICNNLLKVSLKLIIAC